MTKIYFKKLKPTALEPKKGSAQAAGYDLHAQLTDPIVLTEGTHHVINTGIAVQIPDGYVGLIKPRSGLAAKFSLDTMAGVIDSDYRGEMKVIITLHNAYKRLQIEDGDRIAQLVVVPVHNQFDLEERLELTDTTRADKGFGHTGIKDELHK